MIGSHLLTLLFFYFFDRTLCPTASEKPAASPMDIGALSHFVDQTGFEPAASSVQMRRSTN